MMLETTIEVLIVLIGVSLTTSDHGVQFLSTLNHDQLITSSTLKWISANNGKIPINAVVGATKNVSIDNKVKEENIYICRAMHNAEWIPGQLLPEEKACYISLLGLVKSYDSYEVLQNVDNGSRLIWTDWDTYQIYPSGIVAGGVNLYIARKKIGESEDRDGSNTMDGTKLRSAKGYSHYLGKFNSKDAFGTMTVLTEDKQEQTFTKGQLLVESEPVRYELNNVKYTAGRRKSEKKKKLLSFTTLRNEEKEAMKADSVIAYDSLYSSYWGQGSAMLKGLTTVIRNATTGNIIDEIEWGVEENEERKDLFKVEALLQPGTASNVTLWGNETKSELPYTGTLVSFYKDGATTSRRIDGSRRLVEMVDVKSDVGPIFFIHNNSLAPVTTTTTSTTTTTTTTTTTMSPITTVLSHSEINFQTKPNKSNFSEISESESNDLWSDDSAMSLRENRTVSKIFRVDNGSSSHCSREVPSQTVFIMFLFYSLFT